MLILTIHNDGTGDEEVGNYDCEVLVTVTSKKVKSLRKFRVENFKRSAGYEKLIGYASGQMNPGMAFNVPSVERGPLIIDRTAYD